MRKVVTHSAMSTTKKIQAKLMETGTAVSTKQFNAGCLWNLASNHANQPENHALTQAMKKKRPDFAKRHASWEIDIRIETFSVYQNTIILVFFDCIMHSCFANLHL